MSAIYDNWERLVAAVLKKQQLWQLFHQHSRSPSVLSEASGFSSSFSLRSPLHNLSLDFDRLGSSSWSHRLLPKLVLISDFSPPIDVKDVHMASTKLLGQGTFGTVYVVEMHNGVRVVVKRLKSTSISELDFNRQMDTVGNVRHENVIALRAYYSSEDEKLMLYDYYHKGSVYTLLHGKNGEPRAYVDWESRLKIAIGAARGISEIHKHTLVHGNIRASNVFRNPDKYGCVSDLGLTNLFETTFMPTARCYAPEVRNTQNLSQASDVYSFGVLLLELLTRKPSAHEPDGPKAVDLVKLVTSVINRVRAAKVFDADLFKHPTIKEQMVKMFQVGMRCVEKSIKKRPKMYEVVKMLEEITTLKPISRAPSPREAQLIFIEDSNPTFDSEYMFSASAELLAKGTIWNSYKASLKNGKLILVKRLKNVTVTFVDFQKHMEVIGRLRQENVSDLRAYYYSNYERLLVYDYYGQDSVSALLHGAHRKPLDWQSRMKIAVGAARGLTHIHSRDGGKLVHGNIKSSNIFLNKQKYGLVSDTALVKLMRPIRRSATKTPGYYAPEVKDTSNVSQASDVYSFGVFLLELLSGKESEFTSDDGKVVSLVNWIQSVVRDESTAEVFILELLRDENDEETMVQVLLLAMDCVSFDPERRPRMSQVVTMLEDMSGLHEPSIESILEGLLENLLPALKP